MNATEVLDNSHLMIIEAVDHLPELEWDVPHICGDWSVKEIIAHLTSYEQVLVDVFNSSWGDASLPLTYSGSCTMAQSLTLRKWRNANTG